LGLSLARIRAGGDSHSHGEIVGTTDEFPIKAGALKACEHLQLTVNSDNLNLRTITFEALVDRYRAEEMPDRHSTNKAYRSYIETHIRPKWSEWTLRELTSRGASFTIEQWLKSLDLAPKTKGNIRNVMAVIFNCAMRWGFIDVGTSPVSLVRVKGVSRRQKEPRILNPAEIHALVTKLADPARTALVLAIGTGLRCSELFALKWEDVQWEKLSLSISRAIVDGVVGDVKTKYSKSLLPLDPAVAEVLLNWRRRSQFGDDGDWVFASGYNAGELPLRSDRMLAKQIKPAAASAGIGTGIGWHTFRHTYSSMLRQLGVDVKVQQELLRHADVGTTMNLYTQAVSEQKRTANSRVVRFALPAVGTGKKTTDWTRLDISGKLTAMRSVV
jgi:integrase